MTVIQITPRWSLQQPFPHPLHDLLSAYDYIVAHHTSSSPSKGLRPIGIFGSQLGGTLATSLALTESRPGKRGAITALAVQDTIFDWTGVATTFAGADTEHDDALKEMYRLRTSLFASPAAAFDAFASPTLFFRTPGLAIPSSFSLGKESQVPKPLDPELAVEEGHVTRKSHLVFPPRKSGLRIPYTRIGLSASGQGMTQTGKGKRNVNGAGVLERQADDMMGLMRRSIVLHEMKEKMGVDSDYGFDSEGEAERRIDIVATEGDGNSEWAVDFFRDVLGA